MHGEAERLLLQRADIGAEVNMIAFPDLKTELRKLMDGPATTDSPSHNLVPERQTVSPFLMSILTPTILGTAYFPEMVRGNGVHRYLLNRLLDEINSLDS